MKIKPESKIQKEFFNNTKNHVLEDNKKINEYTKELIAYYENAVEETTDKIYAMYLKFSKDNQVDVSKAIELISGGELKIFRKTIKEYMKDISLEGENSKTAFELDVLSKASRVSRYEKILADIYIEMGKMADSTSKELEEVIKDTLKTNFVRSSYDLQKGMGVAYKINMLSDSAIERIIKYPWAKKKYSETLWGHVDTFNKKVKNIIADGFMQGKSVYDMASKLQIMTGACKKAVTRVIQTECKYFANKGELEGYKESGIKKYVYMGSKEVGFACNCASLDGVMIEVDDAKTISTNNESNNNANFPPLHPNCHCSTRAYFEKSILENKDVVLFDKNMTLDEWKYNYILKKEEDLVKGLQEELKCDILKVSRVNLENPGMENKAGYTIDKQGKIILSLFDDKGRVKKQFHNNNHGYPKEHDFGIHGEHVHDWDYEAYVKELEEYKKVLKTFKGKKSKQPKKPQPARDARGCTKEEQSIMKRIL
ncbi:MAG: minor capsid protein [Arcobacter sp.]|nr:minor capsid protein [Arcobacter sp.]